MEVRLVYNHIEKIYRRAVIHIFKNKAKFGKIKDHSYTYIFEISKNEQYIY
jgi:hypothetical protein